MSNTRWSVSRKSASGRDDFLQNDIVQDAVLRESHALAESTQRLSSRAEGRASPKTDRSDIAAFRNVIVMIT